MDWQIRIALIIVGIVVVGIIYYDFQRRKKSQIEQQRLIDSMRESAEVVDSAGFDFTGVGSARKSAGEKAEQEIKQDSIKNVSRTEKNVAKPAAKAPTEQLALEVGSPSKKVLEDAPEIVFSLILKSEQEKPFKGKDFMPLLLSQGLRHGEMGIFHRHSAGVGKPGPIMYSLANAINPGTFELKNIERFETPAFVFFMTIPGPLDPMSAYEGMVKTIQLLKRELGGQILDDTKSVYTEQTHQHQVERLRTYLTKHSIKK